MAHRTCFSAIALLPNSLGAVQFEKGRARPTRAGDLARNFGEAPVRGPAILKAGFSRSDFMRFPAPPPNETCPGFHLRSILRFGWPSRFFKTLGNAAEFGAGRGFEVTV